MDWIGAASVGGIWAGSVGALLLYLHTRNTKAKEEDRASHAERAAAVDKKFGEIKDTIKNFERDVAGLRQQMAIEKDEARDRFLSRNEHAETISALRSEMRDLTRALATYNERLFNMVSNSRQP